jgi:hypothetical protein
MGGRTIYSILFPKGQLLKLRLTDKPICERCQEKHESATHIICDYEAIAYLSFSHLSQFLWNQMTTMTPLYTKSYISFEV